MGILPRATRRKSFLRGGPPRALVLLAGTSALLFSTPASPLASCLNGGAANKAYLLIQHLNGAVVEQCVGFDAAQLAGDDLMRQSGIGYETQRFRDGLAICSIDGEPPKVAECFPAHGPWWSMWVSTGRTGRWDRANDGYTRIALGNGDALGWHYGDEESPPPLPRR